MFGVHCVHARSLGWGAPHLPLPTCNPQLTKPSAPLPRCASLQAVKAAANDPAFRKAQVGKLPVPHRLYQLPIVLCVEMTVLRQSEPVSLYA